jgi:DNA polymerase-3 subunit epsilon/exodeoxyribonuclease X
MSLFVLFDTETTGLDDDDRIIQIGAIIVGEDGKMLHYNDFCKNDKPIGLEAMETHHITNEHIENAPSFSETKCYQKIQEFNNSNNYLIAHNINFDLEMLRREGFECEYTLIDTLRCAKHLFYELPNHRLQYMRYALKLYKQENEEANKIGAEIIAHEAIGDVIVMKLLLRLLVEKAKDLYASERFKNVNAKNPIDFLAKLTQKPVLMKIFNFGKYKGQNIKDISKSDKGYLNWMFKNTELDEDMEYTLKFYLEC